MRAVSAFLIALAELKDLANPIEDDWSDIFADDDNWDEIFLDTNTFELTEDDFFE